MRLPQGLTGPSAAPEDGEVIMQVDDTTLLEFGHTADGNEVKCFVSVSPGDIITVTSGSLSGSVDVHDLVVDGLLRQTKINNRSSRRFVGEFRYVCHSARKETGKRARVAARVYQMQVQVRNTENDKPSSDAQEPSSVGEVKVLIYRPGQVVNSEASSSESSATAGASIKLDRGPTFVEYASWAELNPYIRPDVSPPPYEIGFINLGESKSSAELSKKKITREFGNEYKLWASFTFILRSPEELSALGYDAPFPPRPVPQAADVPETGTVGIVNSQSSPPEAAESSKPAIAKKAKAKAAKKATEDPNGGTAGKAEPKRRVSKTKVNSEQTTPQAVESPGSSMIEGVNEQAASHGSPSAAPKFTNREENSASVQDETELAFSSSLAALAPPITDTEAGRSQTMTTQPDYSVQPPASQLTEQVSAPVPGALPAKGGIARPDTISQDSEEILGASLDEFNFSHPDPDGETRTHDNLNYGSQPRRRVGASFKYLDDGTPILTKEIFHNGLNKAQHGRTLSLKDNKPYDDGHWQSNEVEDGHTQFAVPELNPEDYPKIESIETDDLPDRARNPALSKVPMHGPAYEAWQERDPTQDSDVDGDGLLQALADSTGAPLQDSFDFQESFALQPSGLSEPFEERMSVVLHDGLLGGTSMAQQNDPLTKPDYRVPENGIHRERILNGPTRTSTVNNLDEQPRNVQTLHHSNYRGFGFELTDDDSTASPSPAPVPAVHKSWLQNNSAPAAVTANWQLAPYHRGVSAATIPGAQAAAATQPQYFRADTSHVMTPRQFEKSKASDTSIDLTRTPSPTANVSYLTQRQNEKRKADQISTDPTDPQALSTDLQGRKESTAPTLRSTVEGGSSSIANGISTNENEEILPNTYAALMRDTMNSLTPSEKARNAAQDRYHDAFTARNAAKRRYEEAVAAHKDRVEIRELYRRAADLEKETSEFEAGIAKLAD